MIDDQYEHRILKTILFGGGPTIYICISTVYTQSCELAEAKQFFKCRHFDSRRVQKRRFAKWIGETMTQTISMIIIVSLTCGLNVS